MAPCFLVRYTFVNRHDGAQGHHLLESLPGRQTHIMDHLVNGSLCCSRESCHWRVEQTLWPSPDGMVMLNSVSLYNQVQKENELDPTWLASLVATLAPSSCLFFQRLEYHFSRTSSHAWGLACGEIILTPDSLAHLPRALPLDHICT